jgi:hypothetical protein
LLYPYSHPYLSFDIHFSIFNILFVKRVSIKYFLYPFCYPYLISIFGIHLSDFFKWITNGYHMDNKRKTLSQHLPYMDTKRIPICQKCTPKCPAWISNG